MTGRPSSQPLRRDADPQIALGRRAEELYWGLCGEDLDNENLWTAQFRLHQRTGCLFGLESAVRRLRNAQVEPGTTDLTDIDQVPYHPTWNASHRRFVDASAAARWDQVPEATGQKSVLCASRQLFTHFGPQDLTAGPDGSCRS